MNKAILVVKSICIIMLFWALNRNNPYEYYTLLRWVCCGTFAYLAFQFFKQKKQGWIWVLGITALFYNPFFPVHLNRELWSFVNIVTIIILIGSIVSEYRSNHTYSEKSSQNNLLADTLKPRNEDYELCCGNVGASAIENDLPEESNHLTNVSIIRNEILERQENVEIKPIGTDLSNSFTNVKQNNKTNKWENIAGIVFIVFIIIYAIVGVPALISLLINRTGWIYEYLRPSIVWAAGISLFVVVPISLLLSIFKKTRGIGSIALITVSYIWGLFLWVWSLIIAYNLADVFWLVVGFLLAGIGVVPIALIAALIAGEWATAGQIVIIGIAVIAVRLFSMFLAKRAK